LSYQNIDWDGGPAIVNNTGSGPVAGFVGRHQQGLITPFLANASMVIPQGFGMWLYAGGNFWARNGGATQALPGMKAYASFADGHVSFAATGSAATVSLTGSSIAPATAFSGTGSITGNVLTITSVTAGTLVPGTILTGTGVAAGTQVVSQLSGTTGGAGTYAVNYAEQTVAATTIGGTYGVLTVGGGAPVQGGALSGTGVTAGTTLWGQLSPTTWAVSPSQTVASETMTMASVTETKWICMSSGLAGELVKISDHPLG
jgi:prepilin-type processing-associated H-X9-DG protein